ncbi:MAG: hypothetical protein M1421_01295 [Candidatus Eremiobacteraeota bacterium]|nr:hypothetical protein [Candidatus Eremiobacteraeota bacterium]MCL5054938.1 hypothetical protein [Bacillota bacterium]
MKSAALIDFPTNNLPILLIQGQNGTPTVQAAGTTDGKKTDYKMNFQQDSVQITGTYAGEPINIIGKPISPGTMQFTSQSGVSVNETAEQVPGGIKMSGTIDGKTYQAQALFNPQGVLGGSFLAVSGSIVGSPFSLAFQAVNHVIVKITQAHQTVGKTEKNVGSILSNITLTPVNLGGNGKPIEVKEAGTYGNMSVNELMSFS